VIKTWRRRMGDEDNVCYEYSNSLEDGRERNKRK